MIFDNSLDKENLLTKKTLDLIPSNAQSKEKNRLKIKEEHVEQSGQLKKINRTNKLGKSVERKVVDEEDFGNDSNLKDITVMMKKILDDI